jgi:hypothetical protein
MKTRDIATLLVLGVLLWLMGTAYYEFRGVAIFETTRLQYWLNFILVPVLTVGAVVRVLRARHIPPQSWAVAALLLALPGMLGEALVLSNFPAMMPRLRVATAGRYGGFLFLLYALVLAAALSVSLIAARRSARD